VELRLPDRPSIALAFQHAEIREKGNKQRIRLRDKLRKIEDLFAAQRRGG
jgi:hypothetical protein